jgi:hypothetical protein
MRTLVTCVLGLFATCGCAAPSTSDWQDALPLHAAMSEPEKSKVEETIEKRERGTFEPHYFTRIFTGYTGERAGGGFTLGADLGYRFTEWISVQGFGEVIFAEHIASVFGVGIGVHPWDRVAFVAQPGVEFEKGESGQGLLRVGVHVDLIESRLVDIATGLFVDFFSEKTAYVVGVTFGIDF